MVKYDLSSFLSDGWLLCVRLYSWVNIPIKAHHFPIEKCIKLNDLPFLQIEMTFRNKIPLNATRGDKNDVKKVNGNNKNFLCHVCRRMKQ